MAQMKFKQDRWKDDIKEIKDKIGIPKSIMRWEGEHRTNSNLFFGI